MDSGLYNLFAILESWWRKDAFSHPHHLPSTVDRISGPGMLRTCSSSAATLGRVGYATHPGSKVGLALDVRVGSEPALRA